VAQILFYALRDDMLRVLDVVDRVESLQYVAGGHFVDGQSERYERGESIPDVGTADADSAVNCKSFLVAPREVTITARRIDTVSGPRYCFDQLVNPDSVALRPGGLRRARVMLDGRVATTSDTPVARRLMGLFRRPISKQFTKVKAYWVGPEALALLRAGGRLTMALQSPPEYDLKID
jgi:hypothetical protein